MSYPTLTFASLLSNATRQELEQLVSLLQGYLSVQHNDDGAHTDITGDSLTVTGAVAGDTGTFTGEVTADADGDPVQIGSLSDVLPAISGRMGIALGSTTTRLALVRRSKGTHFAGAGLYSLAFFDLAQSSTVPVLELALDNGVPTLTDGGTGSTALALGNQNRPIGSARLTAAIIASLTASGLITQSGVVTPAQITADQNDYNPTGLASASILKLDLDAARALTGLAAPAVEGQRLILWNFSAFSLTLRHESASSAVANRFFLANAADVVIRQRGAVEVFYQTSRWRGLAI
jgi:hypothetical protein